MQMDDAVHAFDTGHSRKILQFIHVRRIDNHCLCAVLFCKFTGKLRSEACRMDDAVGTVLRMFQHQIRHFVCAALHCHKSASASYKHVHVFQRYVCLF